jgi:AcrR family transcriptional regulator/DNA-binding MarR family transcriptional regulator
MARAVQRRGEATRRRILDAAGQEFAAKGFEGGSMRAIARECGIELALVQYHFKDKLTLWEEVLDDVLGNFYHTKLDEVMQNVAERRPSERIAVYLETLIRHAATDTVFVGIMSHARVSLAPDTDAFRERISGRSHQVVEWIRAAQAEGEAVPGNPVVIFYMMVGAALRIFMLAADVPDLSEGGEAVATLLDEHVRSCISVFLHRAHSETAPTRWPSPHAGAAEIGERALKEPSAVYLFASLESVIRRSVDQELKQLGVTQAQMIALISIASQPRVSSVKLARLLEVSPQTVWLFVKALREKGLIRREADPRARRAMPIEITPVGDAVLERVGEALASAEAALLDALSFEERSILRGLLSRVLKRHRPHLLSKWQPRLALLSDQGRLRRLS